MFFFLFSFKFVLLLSFFNADKYFQNTKKRKRYGRLRMDASQAKQSKSQPNRILGKLHQEIKTRKKNERRAGHHQRRRSLPFSPDFLVLVPKFTPNSCVRGGYAFGWAEQSPSIAES